MSHAHQPPHMSHADQPPHSTDEVGSGFEAHLQSTLLSFHYKTPPSPFVILLGWGGVRHMGKYSFPGKEFHLHVLKSFRKYLII